jgi:hypothetical protein
VQGDVDGADRDARLRVDARRDAEAGSDDLRGAELLDGGDERINERRLRRRRSRHLECALDPA